MKHRVILNIAALLEFSQTEQELLANKAGLSFLFGRPENYVQAFTQQLNRLTVTEMRTVQSKAGISERMFGYMLAGKLPSKESALAMAIAMGFSIDGIRDWIGHAGYCLSRSLPADMLIMWCLTDCNGRNSTYLLNDINIQLEEYGLPLLMTRQSC